MRNDRLHTERMLARALRRKRAADRLVEKWSFRLEALGLKPATPKYPLLWVEEAPDGELPDQAPATLPLPFEPAPSKEDPHARP